MTSYTNFFKVASLRKHFLKTYGLHFKMAIQKIILQKKSMLWIIHDTHLPGLKATVRISAYFGAELF